MPIRTFVPLIIIPLLIASVSISTATAQTYTSSGRIASPLRDTLYILDSTYIEIRLDEQAIYQHFRNDSIYIYPCSTGDPRLPRGISTPEGIFSIRWKAAKYRSRKFDVMMYYWMPFNGGVGMHALGGNAYYWYLGSEVSSHGCVRISREGAKEIFQDSPVGTVVYVHSGNPARVLAFADSTMPGLQVMTTIDTKFLKQRLDAVMQGRADDPSLAARLALPRGKGVAGRISVGRIREEQPTPAGGEPVAVPSSPVR
jgi:hypothetical protein